MTGTGGATRPVRRLPGSPGGVDSEGRKGGTGWMRGASSGLG
jgi:hypothetical protein